jgi:hypothetical protein
MLPHGRSTRFVSARTEYRAIPAKFKPMRPMCVREKARRVVLLEDMLEEATAVEHIAPFATIGQLW